VEKVALSLQKTAVDRRKDGDDFDQFGRSAFNRYYYALFLIVRAFILEFNPDWAAVHSAIPGVLTGSITREIKNFRSSALRQKDHESVEICNRATAALASLAKLMESAYTVRVTADYNPSIKVMDDTNERFSLGTATITQAHGWPDQARILTGAIRRAWRLARGGV
jgi:uncharacterized protein (UPF0332 family)